MMAIRRIFSISLALALVLPFFSFAQISFPSLEPPASITAAPSSPAPGEIITLQAVTPIFDKDTTFYEGTRNNTRRVLGNNRSRYKRPRRPKHHTGSALPLKTSGER